MTAPLAAATTQPAAYLTFFQTWLAAQTARGIVLRPAAIAHVRRVLDTLAAEKVLELGGHLPSLACGTGRDYVALFWAHFTLELRVLNSDTDTLLWLHGHQPGGALLAFMDGPATDLDAFVAHVRAQSFDVA
jgi:hypothetical protein